MAGAMRKPLHDVWRNLIRTAAARAAPWVLLAALAGVAVWVGQGAQAQDSSCGKLTTRIFDTYDLDELRRLLELARESGFSEEQVRNITVEDEEGNTINAFKVIEDIERCRREEKARLEEIQNRKYLTPQDVFKELDGGQKKDLKDLRDKLFPR